MNILFCLTGSIACFKSALVISKLVQQGHKVKPVATESALQFIGAATLEGLTGERVFKDLFSEGQMMDHIHLTKWADLTVVCPATAATLGELANGLGQNTVSTLFLASPYREKPWVVAPAMNREMWKNQAVQDNVAKLESWGLRFLMPQEGHQACGDVGPGRMMEPDAILNEIEKVIEPIRKLR